MDKVKTCRIYMYNHPARDGYFHVFNDNHPYMYNMDDLAKVIDSAKERLSLGVLPLYDGNMTMDIIGYVKEVNLDKLYIECVIPEYIDAMNKFVTITAVGDISNDDHVTFDTLYGFTLVDLYDCGYINETIEIKDRINICIPLAAKMYKESICDLRVYPIKSSKLYFSDESIIKYNNYIDSINKDINVYIGSHEDILESIKNHNNELIVGSVKRINISHPTAEISIKSSLYVDILSKNIYRIKPIFKYVLPYIDKNGNFTDIIGDFYISHFELILGEDGTNVSYLDDKYMYHNNEEGIETDDLDQEVDDAKEPYEYPILSSEDKEPEEDINTSDECEVDTDNYTDCDAEKEEAQVKFSNYSITSPKIDKITKDIKTKSKIISGIERLKEYELRRNLPSGGEL